MGKPAEAEERREHRKRVLKGASILHGISTSEISCVIRNMNAGGAELKVPLEAMVPQNFLLYVPTDGIAYVSELRWRAGERVGIRFTGTAPKPPWHYG